MSIIEKAISIICQTLDVSVDNVKVYGSYAYGLFHKHSDIDLCIVTDEFKEVPTLMDLFDDKLKQEQKRGNLKYYRALSKSETKMDFFKILFVDFKVPIDVTVKTREHFAKIMKEINQTVLKMSNQEKRAYRQTVEKLTCELLEMLKDNTNVDAINDKKREIRMKKMWSIIHFL